MLYVSGIILYRCFKQIIVYQAETL